MKDKQLNNGVIMPPIGFGVYKAENGREVERAVTWALEAGYRLIDTAKIYGNEEGVGKVIAASSLARDEVFITTKLWNEDQGYNNALKAIDESLKNLNLEYVDLYLIHWPSASADRHESLNRRAETWRAMEEIYTQGKARAIGVSNYTVAHLEEMGQYATIQPAVNQVEFHPFLYQKQLLEQCAQADIILEAYTPLTRGRRLDDDRITAISKKYSKTNAQVVLRWSIQHGCVPIPKSVHQSRIQENINIFDFELDPEDMSALDALNEDKHETWDPTLIQ